MTVVAIVGVFALASIISERKWFGVTAATIFALIPELLIWSRVEANANIPFMTFTILTVLSFVLFLKRGDNKSLAFLTFSLLATVYVRVEGFLLIPLLLLFYLVVKREKIVQILRKQNEAFKISNYTSHLALLGVGIILIVPGIYLIYLTAPTISYIAATSNANMTRSIISASNFENNIGTNISFLAERISGYPYEFSALLTVFMVIGVIFIFRKKNMKLYPELALMLLLFLGFFVFYTSYFINILTATGVRFLLVIYPFMAVLAAFGVFEISDILLRRLVKGSDSSEMQKGITYAIAIFVFFLLPFLIITAGAAHPKSLLYEGSNETFWQINLSGYSMKARDLTYTVYKDHNYVSPGCLVFSKNPWIWYWNNVSAANFSYVGSNIIQTADVHWNCYLSNPEYGCPPDNHTYQNVLCARLISTTKPINGYWGFLYNISNYSR